MNEYCSINISQKIYKQVAAVIHSSILNDNLTVRPTLGTTWLSMITSSIEFYRIDSMRYAYVRLSSNLPEITIPFKIQGCGIKAIS